MDAYVGDWEGSGFESLAGDFWMGEDLAREVEQGFEILHAYYGHEDYSGSAFVVLRSRADGSLFEVNGSHCSCHGLEGQWDMEPTTWEALRHRHEAQPLPGLSERGGPSWLEALACQRELLEWTREPEGSVPKRPKAL